jgi:hypothetical protein
MKVYCPGYPMVWEGRWEESEQDVTYAGAVRVAAAFSRFTHLRPNVSFKQAFGEVIFRASYSLDGLDALVPSRNLVIFYPPNLSERLVVHELGHMFELCLPRFVRPSELLSWEGVWDDVGYLITGTWLGGYKRFNGKKAPENGYRSDDRPDLMHPLSLDGGQKPTEDWCDIFMNWVFRSFADNHAGRTLFAWVDWHMKLWLSDEY